MTDVGTGGNEGADATAVADAGAAETTTPPDLQTMLGTRLDEFGTRFDQLGERLGRLEQPAAEEEPEAQRETPQPQFSEDDFDRDGNLSIEAQSREMQRMARAEAEAILAPIQQAAQQERWDAGFDALEETYPDLSDPAKQEQYMNLTVERARELGDPALAQNPKLLESVYLAERAREAASREVPAGDQREVSLERGGGAGPAAAAGEDKRGDGIVSAVRGSQFRLGK